MGTPESCARIIRLMLQTRKSFEDRLSGSPVPDFTIALAQQTQDTNTLAARFLCDGVDESAPEVAAALAELKSALDEEMDRK